ncbi:MAG: aspartyl/glutamyl-tRNA amidotransferase subunit A [Candidatus Muproteobacteria bacterium RIFCSPHIGHO2_02_FULL_60_13]|nr:MAG: aspartyl/glutamyl-tRNA amidotransferase subunit A [Candidatus Muproteobacteria bacterium RIFCSPHIGHO2_02_FULL_60_13]
MFNKTVAELSRALRRKEISSVELTRVFLERINKYKDLNAFITVDPERSLAQAKAADARIARGQAGALTGVPIAQKDIFCADGWLTTCGSKILSNFTAPYDATIIEKFNKAGSVCLGKTNMDEFAMGSSSETSYYGVVKNPWGTDKVPGGSSGGSAAAVAARLAPAATGTDTGGSIRQPASLTSLTGLKPSYGRVSRYGMIAFASSLDQGGPMCRTAEDCALLLNTMAGFDPRDSTSVDEPVPDYTKSLGQEIKGLRIGLPKEYFSAGLSQDVAQVIQAAIGEFKKLGAQIVEISLPNSRLAIPCYYVLAPAEASSNLSRFDGARYGYRAKDYTDPLDMYCKTRAEGFGAEVKRRIMIGTYALSAGYYDAYYLKAQQLRRLIAQDFERAFQSCDVIMGPTSPTTAFKIGEKSDDPVAMYLSDIYTISVNLAGLPGMSIPAGFAPDGLPVGLQLVGRYFDEARLLNVAHRYQQATDWHKRIPKGFE